MGDDINITINSESNFDELCRSAISAGRRPNTTAAGRFLYFWASMPAIDKDCGLMPLG